MFTGLVGDLGTVASVQQAADGARLSVASGLAAELAPGDSVAVNGVCLTVASFDDREFAADVIGETLRRSSLGALEVGSRVNLELALRPVDRLGGHLVQGHVDGLGSVREVSVEGIARLLTIEAECELLRYVVEKGSIAVDGVSLTVSAVDHDSFAVALIPETLERTSLDAAAAGTRVNLEVDILAKYVEKLAAVVPR
ncbi:MAG TPA: riboflavin synthase [Solirubrobacteraceae bacterium]|nr:riboflavin synthase [Solirubrobacteraceae bacterium]